MIDHKYWLSKAQIKALSDEEIVEFYNAWANYWRYDIGINVMPAAWRLIDKEKKFIPIIPWKEYQNKPIPEKLHQEWIDNGTFVTGIAGIFGPVWHRPDKTGYYFGQIDVDNALAVNEIIAWKGDSDIAAFAKRTVVEQHADNLENSMHVGFYSRKPLTNKDPDVPKSDKNRPSFEVRCIGRMGIMSGSRHRKGHPMMIPDTDTVATEPMTLEDDLFEQYLNSICIKHGLHPYLGNGNNNNDNNSGNRKSADQHSDGIPLDDEPALMIKEGIGNYDEKVEIRNGTRHKIMLKIADSILFRYSEEHNTRVLKDWFILINEHCCKPDPLPIGERDKIWNDAVDYVARVKAEESKRILTVSEAIREKPGPNKVVRGTVVSVSSPFKAITKIVYRCLDCKTINEGQKTTSGPIIYPLLQLKKPSKCVNCSEKELEIDDSSTEMEDGKIITLQNIDLNNDQADETLEVLLMGDNTKYTRAGEVVTVNGDIYYGMSNNGLPSKGRKTIALMTAKFVAYEDRQTYVITCKDIEAFHRFANKPNVINRLVSMTAPNIIGENDKKLGGLRSIVGGSEKSHRGRIHTLYIGDFGLAKTLLTIELVKIQPNSRFITIQHASAKSALGIVEKTNDTTTLIYGPIPLSNNAIAGLDELQTWGLDEQSCILSIMEEGHFYLLKHGKHRPIEAKTTIIATMNPQDIVYKNRTTIAKDEITILRPLLDRFDQVYVFLDNRTEQEDREYANKRIIDITKRRPHNYNFLSKYLLYAKTIQPQFTEESKAMLMEFWLILRRNRKQGEAGNRLLEAIFRMADATAKLRLNTVVDVSIANEVQKSFEIMHMQQGQFTKSIDDPRVVAIDTMVEQVHKTQGPIAFDGLVKGACCLDPFVNNWYNGGRDPNGMDDSKLSMANDRKYRELHERFLQRIQQSSSTIIIVTERPLVVMWQISKVTATAASTNDTNDTNDKKINPENQKTVIQSIVKNENPETEILSNMSFVSNRNNGPTYEYLEQVKAYRCNWCKCIYHEDTKDTNAAHPCNFRGREA